MQIYRVKSRTRRVPTGGSEPMDMKKMDVNGQSLLSAIDPGRCPSVADKGNSVLKRYWETQRYLITCPAKSTAVGPANA